MRNGKIVFCKYHTELKWIALALVLLLALGPMAVAQSPKVLTLEEAVGFALKNYPAVRASLERGRAAQAGICLAPTSLFPPPDQLWPNDRAPDNKNTGLRLPPAVLSPLS